MSPLDFEKLGQSLIAFGKGKTGIALRSNGERFGLLQPRGDAIAVFAGIPARGRFIFPQWRFPCVSPAMDEPGLRSKAAHSKRVASLVSDEAITKALLELAAKYEALADNLRSAPPERQERGKTARARRSVPRYPVGYSGVWCPRRDAGCVGVAPSLYLHRGRAFSPVSAMAAMLWAAAELGARTGSASQCASDGSPSGAAVPFQLASPPFHSRYQTRG